MAAKESSAAADHDLDNCPSDNHHCCHCNDSLGELRSELSNRLYTTAATGP